MTPGKNRVQTIYLEGKPTKVYFINTGEQSIEISNNIQNFHDVSNVSILKSLVRTDRIEKPIRESIEKIILHYIDIFNLGTDLLPCTNLTQHTISLTKDTIINTRSYRLPECHRDEIS